MAVPRRFTIRQSGSGSSIIWNCHLIRPTFTAESFSRQFSFRHLETIGIRILRETLHPPLMMRTEEEIAMHF
eukprot:7333355-Prorocentrum_lima.AAC.1